MADSAAVLRSRHGTYHPGLSVKDAEVADIEGPMEACSASARPDTPAEAADRVIDVFEWLEVEELPAKVFETAGRIESFADESDDE